MINKIKRFIGCVSFCSLIAMSFCGLEAKALPLNLPNTQSQQNIANGNTNDGAFVLYSGTELTNTENSKLAAHYSHRSHSSHSSHSSHRSHSSHYSSGL